MKNTRKILLALLVVMTLLVSMATLFASAASQPETLYLTPNANWKVDGARFAAYFFGNGDTWVSMTDSNGDGIYEVKVPTDKVYPNVIFCRMNPSAAANNWDNKWNQTADLVIPTDGPNHYTVAEDTWDKGGGTWSTYGSTCLHTNLSAEATCTTPQTCLDCGDPVVSALGHSFDSAHLCTRCGEQASFTVAGSGAHLGTEWDTGNTANDMTYADGVYTKVYTNVAAGSYAFKVVRDHSWGTAYPSADKAYTVATSGSTVTITLKGTTVNVVVEAPHVHSYFYPCDPVCQECYEVSNPDAKHDVVHVEAVAATCYENGNVEYWYCSYCGATWTDEALTQVSNQMSIVTPMAHAPATHVEAKAPTCYENGNIEYWYCEACGQAWLDADCTQNTNLLAVVLPMAHAEAKHFAAVAPTCTENGNIEYWLCEACGQAWLDADCTQNTNVLAVVLPAAHNFADGKCTVCGEADPDYEAPAVNNNVIDFSKLEEFPKGTYTDGAEQKYNDIFTFYHGGDSRIDGSNKTFDDGFSGTLRFGFGGKWKTVNGGPGRGLQINAPAAGTVTLWWVSGGDGRSVDLLNASFEVIETTGTDSIASGSLYITTFEIPAAGVYYLTNIVNNNYWFKVEYAEKTEAPHEHVWSDATCTEPQKCECGETKGEALGHSFANGVCSVCGAEDPNYVPPHVNTLVVGDTNKIVVSGNFVNNYNLPIEWVTFVADESAHYSFVGDNGALAMIFSADGTALLCGGTGKANLEAGNYLICVGNGAVGEFNVAVTKTAIEEPVAPEYNWWASDSNLYSVVDGHIVYNGAGNTYACVGCDVTTLAAGNNTFTITITNNGSTASRVRVDIQAVNQVGNHKVVNTGAVGGDVWTDMDWGGSVVTVPAGESVTLVITYDENTERGAVKDLIIFADSARGDDAAYSADITVSDMAFSKVSDEPADYTNTLVVGDNNVTIGHKAIDNGYGYLMETVVFTADAKAHYKFAGEGLTVLVYDLNMNNLCSFTGEADLDAGMYIICFAANTIGTTGEYSISVTKSEIPDGPVVEPELPALNLGDNTVTIDGSQTNITGNAVAWYTFTPAEAGTYKFSCDALTVYILVDKNMGNLDSYIGADGVAELEAGTMYYILVGKEGVTGDFTVNVSDGATPAHKNTIAVGDNKYIISDSLLATGYEFLLIEITEGGIYKFTGGAPMTLFVFHDPYVGEPLDSTAPYTDNADDITYEYVEYFYVNLPTPGYYWVGFRYDYVGDLREFDINVALHSEHTFEEGKCECGTADPNYQPPHEHNFVNGECECGEKDPNYNPPEQPDDDTPADPKPEPELNFFQKIWKAITDFFANIGNWFKNLFAKK